jgi:DNA polymerase III alpha subunit (gram-positive type)
MFPSISIDTTSHPVPNNQSQLVDTTFYRLVVLIGHDLENDLRCLRKIDFDPTTVGPVIAVLDTQRIAHALCSKVFFWLSSLCWYLDIRVSRFHISGNDAAYTLLALLRMATEFSHRASTENIPNITSTALKSPQSSTKRPQTITPLDWADNLGSFDAIDF